MRLLYFAQLAQTLGRTEKHVTLPADISDVGSLPGWLSRRGGPWTELGSAALQITVDRQFASADTRTSDANEIGLFPRP